MSFYPQSLINFFLEEDRRLARLEAFCEAHQINFYSAKEEIAKICNDYGFWPNEIQERFFHAKTHGLYGRVDLHCAWFWELAELEFRKNTNDD